MKKLTFLLAVAGSMAFVNCSSDDDKSSAMTCAEHAQRITDAAQAYANDATSENCNNLRVKLEAAIDANCQAASYQAMLDALECN